MRWIRDSLCGLALVSLTAVSVWAAVTVAREFPRPAVQASDDIRQWLTEHDLSQASAAERSRVVRQFEKELRGGEDLAAELRTLDDRQRELLKDNLALLLEQWFQDKVDRYFEQRPRLRAAWLDAEIEEIARFASRGREVRSFPSGPAPLYALGMINNQVEQWIERAKPERQEPMREFWRAVQARALARQRPEQATE